MRFSSIFAICTLFCVSPIVAADDASFAKWEKDISAIEAKIKSGESARGSVVFVGSSSIRKWNLKESFPDLVTANHGFGGSQMIDSVHFFERIVAPVSPKIIVVYAGDNDIGSGKTPQTVADDFQQFVSKVDTQLPECQRVIFVAIKPSVKRWALADKIVDCNKRVRACCETNPKLEFLDIWQPMLDAEGKPRADLLVDDGLHMNDAGYQIWNESLRPLLTVDAVKR